MNLYATRPHRAIKAGMRRRRSETSVSGLLAVCRSRARQPGAAGIESGNTTTPRSAAYSPGSVTVPADIAGTVPKLVIWLAICGFMGWFRLLVGTR
jgi:hypothetical protein